jgi:quercetin dioxygenase-like cupin family protein
MGSRAGDIIENRLTGERLVVRTGSEDSNGEHLVVDLYIRPGGRVVGAHRHPGIEEKFTIISGKVGFRVGDTVSIGEPGQQVVVAPGVVHDWWNAGDTEAHVLGEVSPADRFEKMIQNFFSLANDGKTDAQGMPNLLQLAATAREFDDVVQLASPPRVVQTLMFGPLAFVARLRGYQGSYERYIDRDTSPAFVGIDTEAPKLKQAS